MKPITFLVVEDDDVDVMSIKRSCKEIGIVNPLTRAQDGMSAWEIIMGEDGKTPSKDHYVILLDLNMPRMNGHEFLKKFFSLETKPDCHIFVLTTSDTDQDIIDAYKFDIAGYILKSDLTDSLRESIDSLDKNWMIVA